MKRKKIKKRRAKRVAKWVAPGLLWFFVFNECYGSSILRLPTTTMKEKSTVQLENILHFQTFISIHSDIHIGKSCQFSRLDVFRHFELRFKQTYKPVNGVGIIKTRHKSRKKHKSQSFIFTWIKKQSLIIYVGVAFFSVVRQSIRPSKYWLIANFLLWFIVHCSYCQKFVKLRTNPSTKRHLFPTQRSQAWWWLKQ